MSTADHAAARLTAEVVRFPIKAARAPRRTASQVKKADRAHLLHLLRIEEIQREIDHHEAQAQKYRQEEARMEGNPHRLARQYALSYAMQAATHAYSAEIARNKLLTAQTEGATA